MVYYVVPVQIVANREKNIFRNNNVMYFSRNKNYVTRLPSWKSDDILILSYNSNLHTLSFAKQNDNGKLNSY